MRPGDKVPLRGRPDREVRVLEVGDKDGVTYATAVSANVRDEADGYWYMLRQRAGDTEPYPCAYKPRFIRGAQVRFTEPFAILDILRGAA